MSQTQVIWSLLAAFSLSVGVRATPPTGNHAPTSGAKSVRSPGGRALAEAPVAPTEKTESVEMGFRHPFEGGGQVVMTTDVKVDGEKVTIGLTENDGFKTYAMGFKFAPVMDGTETRFTDSDSAQVVITWKDKDGKVVGHSTNATPQKPKRDADHPAAKWKVVKEGPPAQLAWQTEAPKDATQMEVVTVYTDTLTDTPAQAPRNKENKARSGDLPLIIASFSGELNDGKWKMSARPDDVEKTRKFAFGSNPTVEQIDQTISAVRSVLSERTGYKLVRRPASLEGISSPTEEVGYREILKLIDKAIDGGEIANHHDTGFDIDPSSVTTVSKK